MDYTMALIAQGREIGIPVLPEKLTVSSPGNNDKVTVLGLGEVLVLRARGLRSIAWEGFFPVHAAPYTTRTLTAPIDAVRAIQAARDSLKPIRLILTGSDLDINTDMGIETFEYEEHSGEVGDIYYSIKLSEWKNYAPRRLELPQKADEPATVQEPTRTGAPEAPKSYTVATGDSLWAISRRCYGTGDQWRKIYEANRSVVGANPNLIYPGQVLTIP